MGVTHNLVLQNVGRSQNILRAYNMLEQVSLINLPTSKKAY